jgi:hypothetical protein
MTRSQRSWSTLSAQNLEAGLVSARREHPSMTGNAGGSCSSYMMICGRTKWTIHATGAAEL